MKQLYKLLTMGLIITLFGCKNSESDAKTNMQQEEDTRIMVSKAQFQQNNMALGNLEEKPFPTTIKVNGMIDVPPENKAVVNAITGGYVKTIPLLVGDVVKKGQVLVTIENPEFVRLQQEYMEVKEQLNYLKSEYERQHTMFKENIISQKVYLKAESQYKTANAKYKGFKKQLSLLNINPAKVEQGQITSVVNVYAPIGGSITKVNVSKGAYVSPTTSILEIINNDHIHIELSVFEKDILKIKKGQNIQFSIPEASENIHEAEVYLVGTAIEDNRTIKVHGHPKDESQRFLTGMFVNAEIVIDESMAIALPETAVVEIDDEHFILVLDEENENGYYFKQERINVGKTHEVFKEVMDSPLLKANHKFLVDGAFSLIGEE